MRLTESQLRRIIRQEIRSLTEAARPAKIWALSVSSDGWPTYFGLAAGANERDAITNAGEDPDARGYEQVTAQLYDPKKFPNLLGSLYLTDADVRKLTSGREVFIKSKRSEIKFNTSRDMYGNPIPMSYAERDARIARGEKF